MSEIAERDTRAGSGFWHGLGMFILWLVRLIFAIGMGVVIGVGIFVIFYYAVPYFYTQIINPIQVHSVRINLLQEEVQNTQSILSSDLRSAREEVRALQKAASEQSAQISALQSALASEKTSREQAATALRTDVNRLDELTQKQAQTLGKLDASSTKFDSSITNLQVDTLQLQRRVQTTEEDARKASDNLKTLQSDALRFSADVAAIRTQVLNLNAVITMPITLSAAFERRLVLMQASEAILKARLHLLEKNAGYAGQSLEIAQTSLKRFASLSSDIKPEVLAPLVKRAETAAALIESDPFTAAQELEIVWNNLEKLIAIPVTEVTPASAAPAATVAPTRSVSPAPLATPTRASGLATPPATTAATAAVTASVTLTPAAPASTPAPTATK